MSNLRLVSQQSDAERLAAFCILLMGERLRDLTANLMRISRGAGRPQDLARLLEESATAMRDHFEAVERWPSAAEISTALRWRDFPRKVEGVDDPFSDGLDRMTDGALQIAASHLADQLTQAARGRDELMRGFEIVEEIRRQNREGQAP